MISLDDSDAIEAAILYPHWSGDGISYEKDMRIYYDDKLYRVLQNHISQSSWTPTDAPSLFAEVLIPDPAVIPDWVQPDSTNPYMKGDKVRHNGKVWENTIDNNVWEPGIYGWIEVIS